MIYILVAIVMFFFVNNYNKHYIETKDSSLAGYIQYMKEKYIKEK